MYVSPSWSSPPVRSYRRRPPVVLRVPLMYTGLGDLSPQNQTIASVAAAGASSTVSMLVALGTVSGPIGAAIAGLISVGMLLAKVFGGCGQTCVQATNIANQVAPILQQNLDHYMSAPIHYASMQAAALNNFDTAWNALVQGCGDPRLLDAGKRCVSDRQSGACVWKSSEFGWNRSADGSYTYVPSGPNGSGSACWNWFAGFRDPIANDPTVVPDPVPGSVSSAGLLSAVGINPDATIAGLPVSDLVIPAAIILAAAILL